MTYEEAVRYLLTLGSELAAPRQPTGVARVAKFDLRNITVLAERLGLPQRTYPCVHIAGTNGKGSTAAMLDSILRAAGPRVGLYTSPHLERINERIRIRGEEISDGAFAETFTRVRGCIEELLADGVLVAHPTYFECLTAMAFERFARERVNFGVFEVGMGGRLDATNIVAPEVAVITQIDFDHESYLGHAIEQIAAEKAGIIKPGSWVVSAAERPEARAVIQRRCAEMGARLVEVDEAYRIEVAQPSSLWSHEQAESLSQQQGGSKSKLPHSKEGGACCAPTNAEIRDVASGWRIELQIPLAGRYQARNALAAVAAARLLVERGFPVTEEAIARGIAAVRWPGRLELVERRPDVYIDGTHNPAGARELVRFWEENFAGRRIHLVYGAVRDKAVDEITGLLFPRAATVILTQPQQPRAISAGALQELSSHLAARFEVIPDPAAALERALELAAPEDGVFATGSLYLAGDLRRAWRRRLARVGAGAHLTARRAG